MITRIGHPVMTMFRDLLGQLMAWYDEDGPVEDLGKTIRRDGFGTFTPEGITSYLSFRYPVLHHTMFEGYRTLDCGEVMHKGRIYAYWRPDLDTSIDVTEEEAIESVRRLLVRSVGRLIHGKKRIGITVSGGVDSSLITAIVKKEFPDREVHTYSIGFYGDDEFEYSDKVASLFSDSHNKFVLGKDDYIGENSLLRPLIERKCYPLHPNEIALAYGERKAREDGCEIVLCGEGADDIFGGYGINLRLYLDLQNSDDDDIVPFFMDRYRYFSLEEQRRFIRDEFLVDDLQFFRAVKDEASYPDDIHNEIFYFTQRLHTPGLIERGANALGLNGFGDGFPFIDPELVDYANSLPFDMKVHWKDGHSDTTATMPAAELTEVLDTPKHVLKRVAEHYLPEGIIYRKKKGFPVPFDEWLGDLEELDLDPEFFRTNDVRGLSGWKKFMLINLDTFLRMFKGYRCGGSTQEVGQEEVN